MTGNSLLHHQGNQYLPKSRKKQQNLQDAQEKIYSFLLGMIKSREPEDVLGEFRRLFIDCLELQSSSHRLGVYGAFQEKDEQEFRYTLKRCCYILINNWESHRKYKYINDLINLFTDYKFTIDSHVISRKNLYRGWIINFIQSSDYQELKLFANRYEEQIKGPWINRYSSYLLLAQSYNQENPREQQEAARRMSRALKDKFKFDLAMYIARSQSGSVNICRSKNPTILGENVIRLIKSIVIRKGVFSYDNVANIFIKQTQNQTLKEFKRSLRKYLFFSVQQKEITEILQQQLLYELNSWKEEHNQEVVNKDWLLRISNRLLDCLTTENGQEPSQLFVMLLSQGNPLTLVVILLKIILISRNSRSHLELRIAELIRYYNNYPESECYWVINFIEIFNITFTIYAENVEYNLIKMKEEELIEEQKYDLDSYRVFSQMKSEKGRLS
jgi:hypothetical protein